MVRSQESETKEPRNTGCRSVAEMVKSSCGTESHLDQFEDHQPECDSAQFKESDKDVSINAAEEEAVSSPVVIQNSAVSDGLQSGELALKSSSLHEIDASLIEALSEVKRANVSTVETEEHTTDIKYEPEDQADLESPVIKLFGDMDEVENRTKTSNSPEPQTSHKDQSCSNPYHEHSLDVNGNVMLAQEIEGRIMDPTASDNHPDDSVLEHLEEMCFNSEIQSQAAEETETLEPPAKKRLRRRMGMCGLGDRKRKFPFDGQHCRRDLLGRQREDETGKGSKGVQHYRYNTLLESDDTTPKDHEGSSRPACKDKQEDKENNGTAVMVEEGASRGAEQEYRYALCNMSKCTALMNDDVATDESSAEHRGGKKGTLEENDTAIITDDRTGAEQMVLEHELNLLEDISTGVGQSMFSPVVGEILNMIQDELSVAAAATNDHELEDATCGDEPNFLGNEMTKTGQDSDFNMKRDVLSEKQYLHADNQVDEGPGELATDVEVGQEVSSSSICATVEMSEGLVVVAEEVQEVPARLEESEMKLEEQSPPSMAATEEPDPNGAELSGSAVKGSDRFFVDGMDTSTEIDNAKGHSENDEPVTAVSQSAEPLPAGGEAEGIREPAVPPTAQEDHMHCVTSTTPYVAEQQVCNPTLTPADKELPQETRVGMSVPCVLYPMTDSQLQNFALSMELEDQPNPEGCDHQENATELVCGLIRELSSLNRTVMAAHREMELLRRGKFPKAPNRRLCGPRHAEM